MRLGAPFSFPRSPDLHQAWPLSHAGPSLHRSLRSSSGGEFLQPVTRVLTLLWCRAAGTAMRRASFCCGQQQPFAVGCSYWGRSPQPAAWSPRVSWRVDLGPPHPRAPRVVGQAGNLWSVYTFWLQSPAHQNDWAPHAPGCVLGPQARSLVRCPCMVSPLCCAKARNSLGGHG